MVALAGMVAAVVAARGDRGPGPAVEPIAVGPDFSIVGSAIGLCSEPAALTSAEGSLLIFNAVYRERFGGASPPLELGEDEEAVRASTSPRPWPGATAPAARRGANEKRDNCGRGRAGRGERRPAAVALSAAPRPSRCGGFQTAFGCGRRAPRRGRRARSSGRRGRQGDRRQPPVRRARADSRRRSRRARFGDLVEVGDDEQVHLAAEGESGARARGGPCSRRPDEERGGRHLPAVRQRRGRGRSPRASNLQALLDVLADRPRAGRPRRPLPDHEPGVPPGGGIKGSNAPVYPGDLVVKEDKAAVADAVRRNARGPAMSGDLAVRLVAPAGRAGGADHRRRCAASAMRRCFCCSRTIARRPSSSARSPRRPRCRWSASSPAASPTISTIS